MPSNWLHKPKWVRQGLLSSIPAIILVLLWALISFFGWLQIPSPSEVVVAALDVLGEADTVKAYLGTLNRTLLSFVVSALLGVLIGALIGASGPFNKGLESVVDFLRSIPAPALLPIFMGLFGLYSAPKIALATFVCALVNVIYTSYGVKQERRSLRTEWVRVLQPSKWFSLRSSISSDTVKSIWGQLRAKWFIFKEIILPGAVESILAGFRVTLSLALVLSTLAEFVLLTGDGAGVLIRLAYEDNKDPEMYAFILLLGLIGFILNRGFLLIEKAVLQRKSPGQKVSTTALTSQVD